MLPPTQLTTERLLLSPPTLADAATIVRLADDPLIADPAFMGAIGLHLSEKYGHAEIGYWMGASYRRHPPLGIQ